MKTNNVILRPMGEFLPIVGFENYSINQEGIVFSLISNKILKPQRMSNGYLFVVLRSGGRSYSMSIHRLVAIAFIPNKDNLPCVDHIDGDKTNNLVGNLRWCTQKENLNFPMAVKNRKSAQSKESCKNKVRQSKMRNDCINQDKPVAAISKDGTFIGSWKSIRVAGKSTSIDYSAISKCCRGKYKTAGGFKWIFTPF